VTRRRARSMLQGYSCEDVRAGEGGVAGFWRRRPETRGQTSGLGGYRSSDDRICRVAGVVVAHIYPCIGILIHDLSALRKSAMEYFLSFWQEIRSLNTRVMPPCPWRWVLAGRIGWLQSCGVGV
jgi:hypothetical protein